ncbi:MAG: secretin N-terminal domain-containing protein, partial [Pseudomonadota bacterium]
MNNRIVVVMIVALLMFGCTETTEFGAGLRSGDGQTTRLGRQVDDPLGSDGQGRQSVIAPGTDQFLNERGQGPLVSTNGQKVALNLINVPVEEAANAVLGEALGLNYVVDPGVSGVVTLQTSRSVGAPELLEVFQAALELTGATLKRNGQTYTIVPEDGAVARVVLPGETAFGPRIVAVPLAYVSPSEMTRLLTPIVGNDVGIQSVPRRSVLLLSGSREEVNAALEVVNLFDVDVLKGRSVAIFTLRAADPDAIAAELEQIFESYPGGALENVVSFVPNQRLGAVLAIATRQSYIDDARTWVNRLDSTASENRRRPVVYSVENRSAADLAPIMANLAGTTSDGDVQDGSFRILADDARNAVVVWGNEQEQQDMSRLLTTLDTTPVQVLLEATIAEVTLSDDLEFGLQWFFQNGDFSSRLANVSGGAINTAQAGLSLIFDTTNRVAVLNALNTVTNVDIVSSPSLMVLDNGVATLQIGDEVPVATQTVTDVNDTST